MINITNENIMVNGHQFDYQLENGDLLHDSEWNGERYIIEKDGKEIEYKPVYRFQLEGIDLDTLEDDSDEWQDATQIVGCED